MRCATKERTTKETNVCIDVNIDGSGQSTIDTGVGFFDHMLTLFAFHSKVDLVVKAKGDLYVDDHHTIEDIGILLGECFKEALGDKRGINRYGSARVVMDEALTYVDLDFSGRPYLVYNCGLQRDYIKDYSTEMTKEFLRAFAFNAGITLHVNTLYGDNDHHKVESIFKALGRAVREGIMIVSDDIPSSKGVLE